MVVGPVHISLSWGELARLNKDATKLLAEHKG